jgi:hypothetical protein
MKQCREVTLSGKRCNQRAEINLQDPSDWCYYHRKIRAGLMTPAETIGVMWDEEA